MGIIGKIRSISPILRTIVGLGMMFILPWLWMIVLGLIAYSMMAQSYNPYSYGSNTNGLVGFVVIVWILDYGGAAIFFIIGIVMTISGIMDWWRAKQDN